MSGWQAYIDGTMKVCPDKLEAAAIYGCENHQVAKWAESVGCPLLDEEAKVFDLSENDIRARGVKIGGRKYFLLRCDDDEKHKSNIMQLKSTKDEKGQTLNATVYKTHKVIVFTVGKPEAAGGEVSKACSWCGDYLADAGY